MKYISRFHLNENVIGAKAILKKLGIEQTDADYLAIRDMLKGNDGYTQWFTKLRYVDKQPMDELKNIWEIAKDKSGLITYFTKSIVDLESVEQFWDEVEQAKVKSSAKKVINQFPAHQKSFFSLKDEDDLILLNQLGKNKSLPSLIRKISSFRDKKTLVEAAKRLLQSQLDSNFGKLLKQVEDTGAFVKVADDEHDIIICQVNYNQIRKLGGDTSWCIVRSSSTFDSYADGGLQWVIFLVDNFGKNDRMSKVGLTTHFDYTTAHDKYDGQVNKDKIEKILSERGVLLKDLYVSIDTLRAMPDWNNMPVSILLDYDISKEDIMNKKLVFKNKDRYGYRMRPKKNDTEYFTKEEKERWDILSKTELNWNQLKELNNETILSKKCIQRLDNRTNLSNLFIILKLTKEEVIDNKLYKYTNIDPASLSYFTKDELISTGIIKQASNLKIDNLFSVGFTKEEIVKSYSSALDRETKLMIDFFKDSTDKTSIRNKLTAHLWSDDWERLGIGRDSSSEKSLFRFNAMLFFDIGPKLIQLLPTPKDRRSTKVSLSNIFDNEKLPVSKSILDSLYKIGYKITDKESLDVFIDIFDIYGRQSVDNVSVYPKLSNFNDMLKLVDNVAHKLMSDYITDKIDNIVKKREKPTYMNDERWNQYNERDKTSVNLYIDFWSYISAKRDMSRFPNEWSLLEEKVKKYISIKGLSELRTASEKDKRSYSDFDVKNTIKYADELGFTKKDYDDMGRTMSGITKSMFHDVRYPSEMDKIFEYFTKLGYEVTDEVKIKIIGNSLKGAKHTRNDKDKEGNVKETITYSEEYYKTLVERKLDLENAYANLIYFVRGKNKMSEWEVTSYKTLFKGSGEWEKKLEEAISGAKNKEYQYKILSDLKNASSKSGYGYSTRITPQKWYDLYFKDYVDGLSVFRYDKGEYDLMVLMILTKLDKLKRGKDETESDADKISEWDFKGRGATFDSSLLHTIAKVISRSSRDFKELDLTDDNLKSLYEWTLKHVDEGEQWVQYNLQVCYYLYDKVKFEKYVNSIGTIKDNTSYWGRDSKTKEDVKKPKTVRLLAFKYILSYLASTNRFDELKALVEKVFSYRKPQAPRSLKMNKPELKDSFELLDRISFDRSKAEKGKEREMETNFNDFLKNLIKSLKDEYDPQKPVEPKQFTKPLGRRITTYDKKESHIMKWGEYNKIFELNHYQELSEIRKNIDDIVRYEFGDNGVEYEIQPSNEIGVKMTSLKQRGLLDKERGDDFAPFYINILPNQELTDKVKRSGALDLPEWFGEIIRRVEDYMTSLGYQMIISVKQPGRWEVMDTIDDLMNCHWHIYNIRLMFKK